VEYLLGLHEPSKGNIGVACVYLSYQEKNRTIDELLLSILKQLIQPRKVISETVINTYKYYQNGKTPPSKDKILEMLRCEVDSSTDAFVVVDALDECSHEVRENLLSDLEKLKPKIHLLVTSRYFEIIADRLKESAKLEISARPQDIRAFIKAEIDGPENYRLKKFVEKDSRLLKKIEDNVVDTAKGM
jgi:hypothetical protein